MVSPLETTPGGLRGYLRAHAIKGSVDAYWHEREPQTVLLERSANMPGHPEISLSVAFDARKIAFGGEAVRTYYMIRATEYRDQLVRQELPENVQANLYTPSAHHTDDDETVVVRLGGNDDTIDQLVEDDAMEDDDIRYRYERTVQYRLDGRACLLSSERSERYVSIEDDDQEEVFANYLYRPANPKDEEQHVLDLGIWPADTVGESETVGLLHPDLKKLERRVDRELLRSDIDFLELVRSYTDSEELARISKKESIAAILSILAFLNFEGSATEVQKLI